jgi:uncharacterized LabA/DUF88 family protein
MERVITYIDGFNLYFGLKEKYPKKYLWLNLQRLSQLLLKPHETLIHTKYFTSRVTVPADKAQRQTTYLEALQTLQDFSIYYGHYLTSPRTCHNCGFTYLASSEKMTDVNIAVELLQDAFHDNFDTALLISADSDLTAPIMAVKKLFPQKRIVIAFPPKRFSYHLQKIVHFSFIIGRANLAKSQFPPQVKRADGFMLTKPATWK